MSVDVRVDAAVSAAADPALTALARDRVAGRVFARDATLWGPAAEAEAAIRLGWTDIADRAAETIAAAAALRDRLRAEGVDRVVLCGMGGSSLAPAVIARWSGVELTMLDSTHPDAVRRALGSDPARTVVVVSSKSGSTIETRSHLAAFEQRLGDAGIDAASRIVIVTDPGSPLDVESRAAGRHVFNADPHVGGRFSALTAFGLVPSVLAGADATGLVADAVAVRPALTADDAGNPALRLAAAIAAGLPDRSVLALSEAPGARWGLGAWIEQLIAESTGKQGRGVLPIALPDDAPEIAAPPASTLPVRLGDDAAPANGIAVSGPLGAQLLLWEVATAALGRLMGIDPFDQPDVEAAKVAARAALAAGPSPEADAAADAGRPSPAELAAELRAAVQPLGYLAIQAYVDPEGPAAAPLRALRGRLAGALGVPVALGYGPSFLHSVGQLHKGGPAIGAFLQVTHAAAEDLAIPASESTFGELIAAQAHGDRSVLVERGRPVVVLDTADPERDIAALAAQFAG